MKKELCYAGVLLIAAVLIVNGCSKNKSSNITPTKTNLLGSYKLAAETAKPESGAEFNIFDSLDVCEKDDLLQFNGDSTYYYIDAGIVCNPSGNGAGVWDLVEDGNTLILNTYDTYTVKSFDGKTLVLTFLNLLPVVVYTLTLVRQ